MRMWLKLLRQQKELTQTEVAKRSDITTQFYSYIENGDRRPSVEVAKRIATVLDFAWTLFYETD